MMDIVQFPNFSVNREKYSVAEDVVAGIANADEYGIFSFTVADVTVGVPAAYASTGYVCTFGVEHLPEDDNQAHSEVQAYKNGGTAPKSGFPNKTIKYWFRAYLAELMQEYRKPGVKA